MSVNKEPAFAGFLSDSYLRNCMVSVNFDAVNLFKGAPMTLEERRKRLIELLNDSEEEVRLAAALALDRLDSFQDIDEIIKGLESNNRGQRVKSIFAMGHIKSSAVFPHLTSLLKDPDPDIRSAAVQVLGGKAHPKSLNSLVKHLKDPSPAVRVHTAEALSNFRDERLVPYLSSLLSDQDEQLVISAAKALASIGASSCVEPLTSLTKDVRAAVRLAAVKALGELPLSG